MKRYTVFTDAPMKSGKPPQFEVSANNIHEAWEKAESSNTVSYNELNVENVMLHFSENRSYIPVSEAIEIIHEDDIGTSHRKVCPECVDHEQGDSGEVHDCKTVFLDENRNAIGQCCCYSLEHGRRIHNE